MTKTVKSSGIVLLVTGISKKYSLNKSFGGSFRDELVGWLRFRWKKNEESFLALNDISFELNQGDILGIIGQNGSGKSTLLKILSEVTSPSAGRVEMIGECTSILEIGTGFHPDLSGRENIFLKGGLLGKSREEMERKYDSIVAFSGVGDFISQPLKHYSSGMYLRLAFSVAFHSEVDILLLDEVLSVGDAEFRMKSSERIRNLAANGSTIILASHSVQDILGLCNKCILLERGQIVFHGSPAEVVEKYIGETMERHRAGAGSGKITSSDQPGGDNDPEMNANATSWDHNEVRLESIEVHAEGKLPGSEITMEDEIGIRFRFYKKTTNGNIQLILHISDMSGSKIIADSQALHSGYQPQPMPEGQYKLRCKIPGNWLNRGIYTLHVTFAKNMSEPIFLVPNAISFRIVLAEGNDKNIWNDKMGATLRPVLDWDVEYLNG